MSAGILIIEDDSSARLALARALEKMDYQVFHCASGEDGIQVVKKENIRLILSDVKLPGMDGLQVLDEIHNINPNIIVVVMTAFGTVEMAVKALKKGALDFIEKPLDLEMIRNLVQSALKLPAYTESRDKLLKSIKEQEVFEGMVGSTRVMQEIFETIVKVAPARTTVLITGETGTGKELVAHALHQNSHREGPFVAVNLSALPETLIESELFGHVKGAHSTAFKDRRGRLADADKGTLFLDEVGDIPENIQVKLLRLIENRTYERLGENIPRKVDVRFIAATNVNLEEAVAEGKFRQDLYYRLKILNIHLAPLREHPEDIPLLAQKFVEKYSKENLRPVTKIAKEAMDLLYMYHWPGNIRELEGVIETAVIIAEGDTLLPAHLPAKVCNVNMKRDGGLYFAPGTPLRDVEKEMIRQTLAYTGGNKTKAAELLGIGTRTLYRKIEEYGL